MVCKLYLKKKKRMKIYISASVPDVLISLLRSDNEWFPVFFLVLFCNFISSKNAIDF